MTSVQRIAESDTTYPEETLARWQAEEKALRERHQPFGFNAILGLIGLSGILMRNTLILIGQIHSNEIQGLDPSAAVCLGRRCSRCRSWLPTATITSRLPP